VRGHPARPDASETLAYPGRNWVRGHPARPDASETLAYPGRNWVRGHPARPDASETLAYPGIARTDSVNAYKRKETVLTSTISASFDEEDEKP
jgi:hypothetical protein